MGAARYEVYCIWSTVQGCPSHALTMTGGMLWGKLESIELMEWLLINF